MIIEYMKIVLDDYERDIQLSNKYIYNVVDNKIVRRHKQFDTTLFYGEKFTNVLAFVGANGSGKTSLIYQINNILSGDTKKIGIKKYIVILKSEDKNQYYFNSYNLDIEKNTNYEKISKINFNDLCTRAIYTNVVDGNDLFAKSDEKLIDLSLNYELFKESSSSQIAKSKLTYNQLLLISQNPDLLKKNGLDDLRHPKEVVFEPNLEYLNGTKYQKLSGYYIVYIETHKNLDLYYEIDKLGYDYRDINYILQIINDKLSIIDSKNFEKIKGLSEKNGNFKILYLKLENILKSYNLAVINDINRYIETVDLDFEKKEVLNLLSTHLLEDLFINYFQTLVKEINLKNILEENLLDDTFYLDIDKLIKDFFLFIKDIDFLINKFYSLDIDDITENDDDFIYDLPYDPEDSDEILNFKSQILMDLESENRERIIKQVEYNEKYEKIVEFKWEKSIQHFFKFITNNLMIMIKNAIIFESFELDDYLLELENNHSSNKLINSTKMTFNKKSDKISREIFQSIFNGIKSELEKEINFNYTKQKKLVEYIVNLLEKSQMNKVTNSTINFKTDINSMEIVDYFKLFKSSYKNSMLKFSWRNMSSGELAILNLLSNLNRINYYKNLSGYLLLFIDEGDLYLHPQWQKKYLDMLIKSLNYLMPFKKIQLIITTHSPFIVSDITNQNILFMHPQESDDFLIEDTFAANINELLSTKFFIQDGLTGQFAKNKINNFINELFREFDFKKLEEYRSFINIVGEPLVKSKLTELLNKEILEHSEENELMVLKMKIAELENLLEEKNNEKN